MTRNFIRMYDLVCETLSEIAESESSYKIKQKEFIKYLFFDQNEIDEEKSTNNRRVSN